MIGYASLGKPIWEIDSYRQKWANKANFAETTSIVEAQGSIQLTANSGAVSGLDKRVAGPGGKQHAGTGKSPRIGNRNQ
jgi:hypothetical protein